MPDDDDLRLLRAADPVEPDTLPSPRDPEARALFERITMQTPRVMNRRPLLAAAAALIVVAGAGAAIATRSDDATPSRNATSSTTTQAPVSPGGGLGSCVETYDLDTLANREAAFDGTVRQVEGDTISFTVNRWYRGGSGDTTTRNGASTLGGFTSAGSSLSLEPGQRLLVAGDGGFAWGCGFTQAYDAAVAADWARVLGG